jgi:hypothetical protein
MIEDVLERLHKSTGSVHVTPSDLQREVTRLYAHRDSAGLLSLFEAYKGFELRCARKNKKSIDRALHLAHKNFDYVCEVADASFGEQDSAKQFLVAQRCAMTDAGPVGPIRKLYRDTTGYSPMTPTSN